MCSSFSHSIVPYHKQDRWTQGQSCVYYFNVKNLFNVNVDKTISVIDQVNVNLIVNEIVNLDIDVSVNVNLYVNSNVDVNGNGKPIC